MERRLPCTRFHRRSSAPACWPWAWRCRPRPPTCSTPSRRAAPLRIALEGTYPPFNFKDQKTGQLSGYDVDVARLIATKLGLKPEFVTTEWAAILAGLGAGKYDAIVSQVGINPKRQQAFDFSQPYTYSSPQLIVRKNERNHYTALADLKGKKVGVGQGSVFEQQAKAVPGIEVKSYPAAPENLQDLAFGRIDAALNDSLMVSYLLKNSQCRSAPARASAPSNAPAWPSRRAIRNSWRPSTRRSTRRARTAA
jgi:cystine transport system substrate-binding protein